MFTRTLRISARMMVHQDRREPYSALAHVRVWPVAD
jgi:hypothetical protein